MRKVGHYIIKGLIQLKSGTRVGGGDDLLLIGGADLTVIKDPVTGKPYIPGSSLKGRMRAELERKLGRTSGPSNNEPCNCGVNDCPVCRLFGPYKNPRHHLGPTRLIVRDSALVEGGQIELKSETANRRTTGGADNPRVVERVAPGAKFRMELAVQEFDFDRNFQYSDADGAPLRGREALIAVLYHCFDLIEDSGLGAGVSKGYGQVSITLDEKIDQAARRRKLPTLPPPLEPPPQERPRRERREQSPQPAEAPPQEQPLSEVPVEAPPPAVEPAPIEPPPAVEPAPIEPSPAAEPAPQPPPAQTPPPEPAT